MTEYRYSAVGIRQTETSDWLVMFGAPATEVNSWSGIPRKQQVEGHETTGFQRDNDKARISQIRAFFSDQRNVLQNPLLCASRETVTGDVKFEPHVGPNAGASVASGELIITAAPLEELPLLQILRLVKEQLEQRVPSLRTQEVPDELRRSIKESVEIPSGAASLDAGERELEREPEDTEGYEMAEEAAPESTEQSEPQAALLEETHIADFWTDIAARIEVLEEISSADSFDVIAGFSKDAMISYLRPVVLVDGQHRLLGALDAARQMANDEANAAAIERAIDEGAEPAVVRREMEARMARMLPISLLITSDPAEHVFQFVIVNQKAVQMGRALLGTIVSTTLSADEIARVQDRLSAAEIPIEQSRIMTALVRDPSSPFFQRVERGIETTNRSDLLGWNILASLVKMFRELKGGRPYHEKNDYAADWRVRFLPVSSITDGYAQEENESVLDFWKAPDGPWREVFLTFWTKVRDVFANTEDVVAHNYWGRPRDSNLFNKVSLTILASDFFRFLCERRLPIDNAEQIGALVDDWLEGVNRGYFNRDWALGGVKRDSNGIRAKWSKLWCEYRTSPRRLPSPGEYRAPLKI